MIGFGLRAPTSEPLRVLCLGAHCDDIEIGCGGTLLRLRETHPDTEIRWHVLTSDFEREIETRKSAALFGVDPAECDALRIDAFRDGFLPYEGARVKDAVLAARTGWNPDLIFTHAREDRHQDHRVVSELTWNAYRDHMILEYEIPKWDGDLGQPNVYVTLGEATVARKLSILDTVYLTQKSKASCQKIKGRGRKKADGESKGGTVASAPARREAGGRRRFQRVVRP